MGQDLNLFSGLEIPYNGNKCNDVFAGANVLQNRLHLLVSAIEYVSVFLNH